LNKHERGLKIRRAREHKGFSQEKVADVVGVTGSMITQVKSGSKSLQFDKMKKLCILLGINMENI